MIQQTLIPALLFVATVNINAVAQQSEAEDINVRGAWKILSMIEQGTSKLVPESSQLQILENKLRMIENGEVQVEFRYTIDQTQNPMHVDLRVGEEVHIPGIFEIKEGKMTICISADERRPTKFESPENSSFTLLVVERK